MRVYIVTHNLTGYLPESSPYYTTDRDSAYAYALDEIDARLDWYRQMPDEYRNDAWEKEVAQVEEMQESCRLARTDGGDGWSDQTIGPPYTTFSIESFECGSASELAGWTERTLAELELSDNANIDDVCETLNREGW